MEKVIPLINSRIFSKIFNNPKKLSILEKFISVYLEMPLEEISGNLSIIKNSNNSEDTVELLLKHNGKESIIELNTIEVNN